MKCNKALMYLLTLLISNVALALDPKSGVTYIFNFIETVSPCTGLGVSSGGGDITIQTGVRFEVVHVNANGDVVIAFKEWKNLTDQTLYNYTFSGNTKTGQKYFLVTKSTFDHSCGEYIYVPTFDVNFGTLTTPFRFRHQPFLYTNNISLGATVAFTKKIYKNFSIGAVPGLSLTQIDLDKFSTNGFVSDKTERPAITPSFSVLFGFKSVNVTAGIGWDIVNKVSDIEKSWIYNGQHWFGIGIGVNLFSSTKENSGTAAEKPAAQTDRKAK